MKVTDDCYLTDVTVKESPNCDSRPRELEPNLLVIHCISLPEGEFGTPYVKQLFLNNLNIDVDPSFSSLQNVRVSSHVFIDRQGDVTQFVPFDRRAWHAGKSNFQGRSSCNDFSIGIELEGTDSTVFESIQYAKLAETTTAIMQRYPRISFSSIVGHQEIAPERKTDPGKCFDWKTYFNLVRKSLRQ
ncbi:MAG: 1,6-anhydro-N-acetylmuramyl-L-alanine amidase AmpD [Gammaproteobacteria bacterium]|nr:1,6-anhydro-N-acetylmuramyl-L-alanine amidase AmpD [Gammaproteobacteria bacterium]